MLAFVTRGEKGWLRSEIARGGYEKAPGRGAGAVGALVGVPDGTDWSPVAAEAAALFDEFRIEVEIPRGAV